MKILYLYPKTNNQKAGGDIVNLRNLELLTHVCKDICTYEIPLTSKYQTLKGLIEGYGGCLRKSIAKDIIATIGKSDFELVFLWSSKAGKLAELIAKTFPNIRVITFFHNVEIQYGEEELKSIPSLKNRFINYIVRKNELLAVERSDALVVMNNRDNYLLQKYYGKQADLILPLGLSDCYNKESSSVRFADAEKKLKLLFVGSAFFANVRGLKWFIKQVYPYLSDVELLIVGKKMGEHFSMSQDGERNATIKVLGYIDDLEGIYEQSHIVISPIFEGGGMKTKTAEAMMYGCPIIGTAEAFEGYEIDYEKIGGICNSPKEFLDKINQLRDGELLIRCSKYSRNAFIKRYETNALCEKTIDFLSSLLNS